MSRALHVDDCSVVDIFCGIGGLTHGFVAEGFRVVAGVDADESCAYAYETNNEAAFIHEDVRDIQPERIEELFGNPKVKILIGCAPCQPFSQYTSKHSENNRDWELVAIFSELISSVRPDIVSMENVPQLQYHEVFRTFLQTLKDSGYELSWEVVYGPDYGLPQERERLLLLASRLGAISLVKKTHTPDMYVTVHDAIAHLPRIEAGDVDAHDRLHKCSRISEKNHCRIKHSLPGGTWRDWPDNLRADCHKKESGKGYGSVYGRMEWHKPAPTITTQFFGYGNGRFGHPEQNRAISLREGALLQTFPSHYEFVSPEETIHLKTVGRHIGNSVPVLLAQIIAKSIRRHLEDL